MHAMTQEERSSRRRIGAILFAVLAVLFVVVQIIRWAEPWTM